MMLHRSAPAKNVIDPTGITSKKKSVWNAMLHSMTSSSSSSRRGREEAGVEDGLVLVEMTPHSTGHFTTTEVLEDDMVCGIEVAPSLISEGGGTLPTDPLTTEESHSWSLSTQSSSSQSLELPGAAEASSAATANPPKQAMEDTTDQEIEHDENQEIIMTPSVSYPPPPMDTFRQNLAEKPNKTAVITTLTRRRRSKNDPVEETSSPVYKSRRHYRSKDFFYTWQSIRVSNILQAQNRPRPDEERPEGSLPSHDDDGDDGNASMVTTMIAEDVARPVAHINETEYCDESVEHVENHTLSEAAAEDLVTEISAFSATEIDMLGDYAQPPSPAPVEATLEEHPSDENKPMSSSYTTMDGTLALVKNAVQTKLALKPRDMQIINLLEPCPEVSLSHRLQRHFSTLCRMTLRADDVPFLLSNHSPRRGGNLPSISPPSKKTYLRAPFIIFPNQSFLVMAEDVEKNMIHVCSQGPIPAQAFQYLFQMGHGHCRLGDNSSALVRPGLDKSAADISSEPEADLSPESHEARQSMMLRLQISHWRGKKSPRPAARKSPIQGPARNVRQDNLPHDRRLEGGESVVCTPRDLKSMVAAATSGGADANTNGVEEGAEDRDEEELLFHDEELRVVMQLTDHGSDTSPIFPAVMDDDAADCESDDGLGDELGALYLIERDLRKELETADIIIRGVAAVEKKKSESDTEVTHPETDPEEDVRPFLGAGSSEDDEEDDGDSEDDSSEDLVPLNANEPRRRVRFSSVNREYFISYDAEWDYDNESLESTELPSTAGSGTFESFYLSAVDVVRSLATACTSASRRRPSTSRRTRVSSAY